LLILTALLVLLQPNTSPGDRWAEYLERANADAANCQEFLEVMDNHKDESPTAKGYYALATMIQAKRFGNPFTKLSYFNKGKKILEMAISENPQNAELRFLRFAVQTEVPAILLYYHNIENDQLVLDDYVKTNDDGLAERIRRFYDMKDIDFNS
jgi:hypothetical protein